jgi:carboxyl-terminal processing protease
MKSRNRLGFLLFGCLLFFLPLSGRLPAAEGFQAVDSPLQTEVLSVLHRGQELEQQRRWGEALTCYEEAARRYPGHDQLTQRMLLARQHFDLVRRYDDASYLDVLRTMSEQQALDLYAEVVAKIQSHYVQQPDWDGLLRRGTDSLRIALYDPCFATAHHFESRPEQIDPLLQYVESVLAQRRVEDGGQSQELVRWIGQLVSRRLPIPASAVVLEYTCGATTALDTYSTFLTADQLDEVYSQIEGNFVGLGIELKPETDALLIADVISNGPAEQAGLRAGDRIIGVNGTSTATVSADHAANLLKGEQGTYVEVTLRASNGEVRRVQVRRERVDVPSVEDVRMLDAAAGVAYFRISSFQKTTSRDVDAALWKLHREGMRSLVVDVRGNPGGLLNEAVEVADRFVMEGTIVATHGRSARENYEYKAHRVGTWRVPLVVLIDGDSASASEIFAGAIRDHRRGTVVGDRSYGKGSVQGIFPLRAIKGGLRLTTAKFYCPSGRAISQGGIEPDIRVQTVSKPVVDANGEPRGPAGQTGPDDPVVSAGARVARELTARRQQPGEAQQQSAAQADSRRVLQRSGIGW